MPQLDALRAFAVIAVAVSHWTPVFLVGIVPWGTGVQLFFVLSGFLITGILLRSRPSDLGISLWSALRIFYARRILRIFPIYYAVLAFSLLFAVGSIRETWPWHVAYLSNFYYATHVHGTAIADPYLHFWSLAVEEQFYLFWPLIALVLSRRALAIALYSFVAISIVFRVTIDSWVPSLVSVRYLTPSCLDALAIGALIAHARHYAGSSAVRRIAWIFAAVGVLGLVVTTKLLPRVITADSAHRIGHTFLVIFYGAIVAKASEGFGGVLGRLLSLKPLLYLGKISYGIYVYHYFAAAAIAWIATRTGWEALQQRLSLTLVAYAVFTVVLAVVSWHFFELPINRLKNRFEYPRAGAPKPAFGGGVATAARNV